MIDRPVCLPLGGTRTWSSLGSGGDDESMPRTGGGSGEEATMVNGKQGRQAICMVIDYWARWRNAEAIRTPTRSQTPRRDSQKKDRRKAQ